jgi:hypothetical protein
LDPPDGLDYSYLMEFLDAGVRLRGQQQGYGAPHR